MEPQARYVLENNDWVRVTSEDPRYRYGINADEFMDQFDLVPSYA